MYANRDAAVPVVPVRAQQGGLAALPILALCCLLFILLLIASTIVLALIPVYLQTAKTTRSSTSATRSASTSFNTILPDGTINGASRTNLANAIAARQGLPAGSVTVSGGTLTTGSGRRKRRGLLDRSERQAVLKTLIFTFFYNLIICGAKCTNAIITTAILTLTQITLTIGTVSDTIASLTLSITSTTQTATAATASTTTATSTSTASSVTTGVVGG